MDLKKVAFGWVPDLPDHRDFRYAAPVHVMKAIPAAKDLKSKCPRKVYDQGQLGSCTANAIAGALEFDQMKQKGTKVFTPSRLFIYYNERVMEHTVNEDSGAMIRDGIKSVNKDGACPETMWPYKIEKFTDKPTKECYAEAKKFRALTYQRIGHDLSNMKGCIAEGFPFVFGIAVYSSFMTEGVAKNGLVPMPGPKEKMVGGHAMLCVGYSDATRMFHFRNSWGKEWGEGGYGYLPYAYLSSPDLADDFWTIRLVTDPNG